MTSEKKAPEGSEPLRQLQREFADFLRPFQAIQQIKATSADVVASVEKALTGLPTPEFAAAAVRELHEKASKFARQSKSERERTFGATLTAFLKECEATQGVREINDSWRIGPLEIAVRRDRAEARALYNEEPVVEWRVIDSVAALHRLFGDAQDRLRKSELPTDLLVELLWTAYRHARSERKRAGKTSDNWVPIRELYTEVRIALVRDELRRGKADRKLTRIEFPAWAFLYNFDRYLALGSKVPEGTRLRPETGSQAEAARPGMAMTTNGLVATQPYKSHCYVAGPIAAPARG